MIRRRRTFNVGEVVNCPRSNLPKLGDGLRWVEFYDDGCSWQVVEVVRTESSVRQPELGLRPRNISSSKER